MSGKRQKDYYDKMFILFSSRVETFIIRVLACLFMLLVIVQCLLQFDGVRHFLSRVDRLEGKPYEENTYLRQAP